MITVMEFVSLWDARNCDILHLWSLDVCCAMYTTNISEIVTNKIC